MTTATTETTNREGHITCETHSVAAEPVQLERGSHPNGENQSHPASPLSKICGELSTWGRRRQDTIRRQWLIERPSEQQFKYALNAALGKHELGTKELYGKAASMRNFMLKHTDDWINEVDFSGKSTAVRQRIAELNNQNSEANAKKFEFESESNGKKVKQVDIYSDVEMDVMAGLSVFVSIERAPLNDLAKYRDHLEKTIEQVAETLPVCEWWASHRGMKGFGLGCIIAETGDLNNYSNPDKVKKRMGLAPYRGEAYSQWRKTKTNGLSKQEWIDAGYVPRRRSVIWKIGDAIIKNGKGGPYRAIYDARKLQEIEKAIKKGLIVMATSKTTADNWGKLGLPRPVVTKTYDAEKHRSAGHIHNRAQRYMEQRLLIDLWAHWTGNVRC